ncbi:MAG: Na(+)-translocating NADH-quinone reductase subunit A [Muribaculaceae bacterium]|nr:Na(+)-translocating NADH-quinone reductase subunit A [Muribaculaceae bacterium]MBR5435378.1 Na(+)-translocating NADH-quinone reductase subunit A [Muribaculaceae bacterium]
MDKSIKIKKGLDLRLVGGVDADKPERRRFSPKRCAIVPDDFRGFIPKLEIKEGDLVKAGDPILRDKNHEAVKLTSPVSGKVESIVRGARRKIERIVIESDGKGDARKFDVKTSDPESIRALLAASGIWAKMRQRPYDIVPADNATFRDIFVSGIDSAPLAADIAANIDNEDARQGAKILTKITDGCVYIGLRENSSLDFSGINRVVTVGVTGPHPAGNVGVQIANVKPVNKDEIVLTLDITALAQIGKFFSTGEVPYSTVVALTGSEVKNPKLIETVECAELSPILEGELSDTAHKRIISGNVLTGTKVEADGYLRFPYRQITVIPEGDDVADFLGWASLSLKKMSVNRSFPGHFLFKKRFAPDARILGGKRAMIMSGEYERVFPMDILPEYLLKAIISRNIEQMEQLGIYEVAPEDFALAEYVDSSKLELQKIVEEGLEYLRKELD